MVPTMMSRTSNPAKTTTSTRMVILKMVAPTVIPPPPESSVELKEKPSLPWGQVGVDSYGNKPTFCDRGQHRKKAVCALGRQDFDAETCTPLDPGVIILGASSDHLMLDVTDSEKEYRVGDIVQLQRGYLSTMRALTSEYVEKVYLG